MNNQTIDKIKQLCFNKGRCNPNLNRYGWWERRELLSLRQEIMDYTKNIPESAKWTTRLWHCINRVSDVPVCNNRDCNNNSVWIDTGYQMFCSTKCANSSEYHVSKRQNTCISKYGSISPLGNADIQNKSKKTIREKYGVDNVMRDENIKAKMKNSTKAMHGVEHALQSPEIKEKVKNTNREKYNSDFFLGSKKYKQCMSEFKRDNPNQLRISDESYELLKDKDYMISTYRDIGVYKLAELLNVSNTCIIGTLKRHGVNFNKEESSFELEIVNTIKSFYDGEIIRSDRKILSGKELDIVIPEFNLAIECNGTYWHSEAMGKDSKYHLDKTKQTKQKGYNLLHIWLHEWNKNADLIISRIKSYMKMNSRIYARKCEVREVNPKDAGIFLDNNHIQGKCRSKYRFGLYYNNELVALMTFGVPRYNNSYDFELLRYCSLQTFNVTGGASKLLKAFLKAHNGSIISYSDVMRNSGNLYPSIGFQYSHSSKPSYFYTKDYNTIHNRSNFQKHKLKDLLDVFDPDLTEVANMKNNGYTRIWDCGTDVWVLPQKSVPYQ